MGVKFLGTLKNTEAFPFHIEDVNVKRATTINNKVIVQCYGTRSSFECRTKVGGEHKLKVVVVRHGTGRLRCVRLGTNLHLLLERYFGYLRQQVVFKGKDKLRGRNISNMVFTK